MNSTTCKCFWVGSRFPEEGREGSLFEAGKRADQVGLDGLEIRSFDKERDSASVQELERRCEVGPGESSTIVIDTMGDPMCRVRNSPQSKTLVAEVKTQLVGVVRGSIKIVTTGPSMRAKVGYVLGLRVSPHHRRRGIGLRLVQRLEDWFRSHGVDYSYMATEKDNRASLKLFMERLGYIKFRTPSILVNPVANRPVRVSSRAEIRRVSAEQAGILYQRHMSSVEFFPHDIDMVLRNKLSLGTWVAYPKGKVATPASWAMLSVWNAGEVFKITVGKAPPACIISSKILSLIHRSLPCLKLPSLPDSVAAFGVFFVYGVYGEGPEQGMLVRSLCHFVHNLATKCSDCKAVVAEVGGGDCFRQHIPHWQLLSCPEDIWCIKSLTHPKEEEEEEPSHLNWVHTPQPRSLFVDPREV